MTASWPTSGVRWITATVTDDNGATDSTSVNVSVINSAPRAKITNSTDVLALNEGDNLTLSGITTTDTAYDKLSLIYAWDSNHIDSDLDGEKSGDIDYYGEEFLMADLPAGSWTISLTVTDDDGEFSTTTIDIKVKAKPADNFLESITDSVGGVGTMVIGILAIVIIGLAAFLLFTRNSNPSPEKFTDFNIGGTTSQFSDPISTPGADAGFGLYQQETVQPDPYAAAYNPVAQDNLQIDPYSTYNPATQMVAQPAPIPAPAPAPVQQGPPLPVTGLPQGWTMDQWQHYGAQYLAAQNAAQAPIQPTTTGTTTQSPTSNLNDLLDDLDL
jgi:hypothetical protein